MGAPLRVGLFGVSFASRTASPPLQSLARQRKNPRFFRDSLKTSLAGFAPSGRSLPSATAEKKSGLPFGIRLKSGYRNSNPRPLAPQTSTLTSCAIARCAAKARCNCNGNNITLFCFLIQGVCAEFYCSIPTKSKSKRLSERSHTIKSWGRSQALTQ